MAFAAVVSLKQTIERLHQNPSHSILLPDVLLPDPDESIYKSLRYSQWFLETVNSAEGERADAWEGQIREIVQKIEDLIEFHISKEGFLSESENSKSDESLTMAFPQQLLKLTEELHSILWYARIEHVDAEKSRTMNFEAIENQQRIEAVSSTIDSGGGQYKMVGLDDQRRMLKDYVLSDERATTFRSAGALRFISIVGMAGIGKTALAEQVYNDPSVIDDFDLRLFLPIGPKCNRRTFLLFAFHLLGVHVDDMDEKLDYELGQVLYNSLSGRKYLIVLDDIWSTMVWDEFQIFFPDNDNNSRIILTTSVGEVAHDVRFRNGDDKCNIIQVRFLNDDESWNLLHDVVFDTDQELCSPQHEIIGKKIAKNCEGLPLAIIEVGKLLRKTEKTVENWMIVAENEDPIIVSADSDTDLSKALSSSYKMLPQYLKACFLYMGGFPKDYEITPSHISNLWIAEGIIEAEIGSLEEIARKYLEVLVFRNLVLVHERSSSQVVKTCRLHFVFRNLCVSLAQKEKFFHFINKYANSFPDQDTNCQQRRLCAKNNIVLGFEEVHGWMESVSAARSLLCFGPQQQYPIRLYFGFRLLKTLDALRIRFYEFPQVLELVQLRYLAITYDGDIPGSISRLWKLEILIVHRHQIIKFSDAPVYLPKEIWKLCRLRHLDCMGFDLLDPSNTDADDDSSTDSDDGDSTIKLRELITVSGVSAWSCTRGVLARMPCLRKLGVRIESAHGTVETFSFFNDDLHRLLWRLESFTCAVLNPGSRVVSSSIPSAFLINLAKINLSGCGFSWDYMSVIGSLLKLQVLKLRCFAFQGPEWKMHRSDDQFMELRFLLLEDLDIQHWISDSMQFPSLRRLVIRHCYKLRKIPSALEQISTLEMIEVDDCSPSVSESARNIQEAKLRLRSDVPQVGIHCSWDDHKKLKT